MRWFCVAEGLLETSVFGPVPRQIAVDRARRSQGTVRVLRAETRLDALDRFHKGEGLGPHGWT